MINIWKCTEKELQKWIQQSISINLYSIKIDHNDIRPNNIMINANNDVLTFDQGGCNEYIPSQIILQFIKINYKLLIICFRLLISSLSSLS